MPSTHERVVVARRGLDARPRARRSPASSSGCSRSPTRSVTLVPAGRPDAELGAAVAGREARRGGARRGRAATSRVVYPLAAPAETTGPRACCASAMRLFLVLCALLALPPSALAAGPPAADHRGRVRVTRTAATLNGTVDPNGSAPATLRVRDDDGVRPHLRRRGHRGRGRAVPVAAGIRASRPGTTYHYRLVATNADGGAAGGRPHVPHRGRPARCRPSRSTVAREVGPTGATLRSRIDPNGGRTTYHFEYGPSQGYGSRTPERDAGAGDSPVNVAEAIGGLQPYRRYHFRVVATNEAGRASAATAPSPRSRRRTAVTLSLASPRIDLGRGHRGLRQGLGLGRERRSRSASSARTSRSRARSPRPARPPRFRPTAPAASASTSPRCSRPPGCGRSPAPPCGDSPPVTASRGCGSGSPPAGRRAARCGSAARCCRPRRAAAPCSSG